MKKLKVSELTARQLLRALEDFASRTRNVTNADHLHYQGTVDRLMAWAKKNEPFDREAVRKSNCERQ